MHTAAEDDTLAPDYDDLLILRRDGKSLVNTFPFNLQQDNEIEFESKQGVDAEVSFDAVARAGSGLDGEKRCIEKVVMEEQTEWEEVYTCDHSYNRQYRPKLDLFHSYDFITF